MFLAAIARERPDYLRDPGLNAQPDARHYVRLGRNLVEHGVFSRSEAGPLVPDMYRTPAYPLFVGVLERAGGAAAIYAAQGLLHAALCLIVYRLALGSFGRSAALLAAAALATDLMLMAYTFEAMSETLSNFLVMLAVLLLFAGGPGEVGGPMSTGRVLAGALSLGLSVLARPSNLYVAAIAAAGVLAVGAAAGRVATAAGRATLVAACVAAVAGGWVARNAVVLGLPRLTFVDKNNLVYYAGAGAFMTERGISFEAAQRAISEEYGITPVAAVQNDYHYGVPPRRIDAELGRAWPSVLSRYPRSLVLSSCVALLKASVSHNVGEFATVLGREYRAPGTAGLARLSGGSWARLRSNGPLLCGLMAWQVGHTLVLHVAAALGVAAALVGGRGRRTTAVLLALLAYAYLSVTMFGRDTNYRCRIPAVPLLAPFSGLGLTSALNRFGPRRPAAARPLGAAATPVEARA